MVSSHRLEIQDRYHKKQATIEISVNEIFNNKSY